jgi:FtsH-binding integral membrane protein
MKGKALDQMAAQAYQREEAKMKSDTRWLRISYWAGAIIDGLAAVSMLATAIFGVGGMLSGFSPGAEYRYAMGLGGSLMAGWTALLIWADRKPLERKGVLLLTVFPVMTGIVLRGITAVLAGLVPLFKMLPGIIVPTVVGVLMTFAYLDARQTQE